MRKLLGLTLYFALRVSAQEIHLPCDAATRGAFGVRFVEDGHLGGIAARFEVPGARIDAGPCGFESKQSFGIQFAIRTREPGFATPIMARKDDAVGASFVLGREPGRISFEAWSWQKVRLLSLSRVDDGRWHTVSLNYDAPTNVALLSIDSVLEAGTKLGEGQSSEATLRLGNNIGAHQPFRGDLDEFMIHRKSLNPEGASFVADSRDADTLRMRLLDVRQFLPLRSFSPQTLTASARSEARAKIQDALGLEPWPARPALNFIVHGERVVDGARIQRVSYRTWADIRATAWLWTPHPEKPGRRPAVLCPHGHWENGALNPVVQARARRFAESGYIVLVVDSVHVEDVASGVNSVGVMTWNNIRGIDLLVARKDVDATRIGVTGASGGAQQAMYLMALEDRLAVAAPICMISRFSTILDEASAHCGCNHVPRLARLFDQPELCMLFAPRPAFFGSVTGDWTKDFPREGWPEMQTTWKAFGAPDSVEAWHEDAGHNYDRPMREKVYAFFDRHLKVDAGAVTEREGGALSVSELSALGPAPTAPRREILIGDFLARRARRAVTDLAPGLPAKSGRPPVVSSRNRKTGGVFEVLVPSQDKALELRMLLRESKGVEERAWIVFVDPRGASLTLASLTNEIGDLDRVAILEPRFLGEFGSFAKSWRRNGLLLGRGEGYEMARDIATLLDALPGEGPVTVVGRGFTAPSVLLAVREARRVSRVVLEDIGSHFRSDGNRLPLCPDILRFGDLEALIGVLAGPRSLVIGGSRALQLPRMVMGLELKLFPEPLTSIELRTAIAGS